jgi:mRNA interferase RelE/StbE
MIIEIDDSFKKDFKRIKDINLEKRIIDKLNIIETIDNIYDISNIKTMKWFSNFYRIRIWDYRIGLKLEWNIIILLRIRNRKDIYNIFP